jgi:hypothetical protein
MKPIIISYKPDYSLRERMLLWLLGYVIQVHARFYSKRPAWGLQREDMQQYPAGTLGRELGMFLEQEDLQPVDRVERHDAFHILLDFSTSLDDESAMQFFLVGNGKISPFTLATAVFTGLVMPDKWPRFYKELRRGWKALSISKWDFQPLLSEDFENLKKVIFFQPVSDRSLLYSLPEESREKYRREIARTKGISL